MNKNYRVVWNDARQAFVAVSENKKTRGKPKSSVRSALALAVGALFLAPAAALAACPSTITTISTALTESQCYGNESVAITSTGSVSVTNTSLAPAAVQITVSGDYTGTFSNAGSINSTIMGAGYQQGYGVYVFGNYSPINLAPGSSITNAGVINASTTSTSGGGNGSAYSYGMQAGYAVAPGATLSNTGTINASAAAFGTNVQSGAYALYLFSNVDGVLTNSGRLSASATSSGDTYAYANTYGLSLSDVNGRVANTGTISASSVSSVSGAAYYYGAYAYGVSLSNIQPGGQFSNAGSILANAQVSGNSTGGDIYAYGFSVGNVFGTFENSGSIRANASASGADYANVSAYGTYVGSDLAIGGSYLNAGSIVANAATSSSSTSNDTHAYAYGAYFGNTLAGAFTNTGTISATASGAMLGMSRSGYGYAYGVYVSSQIGALGSFANSGSISASATATGPGFADVAQAYGVRVGNNVDGAFSNAGTISATATSSFVSEAYGVTIDSSLTGTLTNTGAITATATSPGTAIAFGLRIGGAVDNTLTNSGIISATASSSNSAAEAYGVTILGPLNGTLTNTGTISASVNAAGGGATALRIQNLNGTVDNSGTISATGSSNLPVGAVWGIFVAGGSGTINNLAGGVIEGGIHVDGGSFVSINNAGVIDTRMNLTETQGPYTQAATGVLRIAASDNATHGSLVVGNAVTLAPGTTISIAGTPGHTLAPGTVSSVISTSGLTMSTVNVTDNVLALNYQAVRNADEVDLVATSTGLTTVQAAVPGSMGSAGGAIDSLLANINTLPQDLQNYLYNLGSQTTTQGVTDEVRKIQPMVAASLAQTGLDVSRSANNVVVARLDEALGRSAGDKFYGDRKFWLKPFGSWADQNDRDGVTGYKARSFGLIGGVDADIGAYRLGAAFGFSRSDVDGNSSVAPQSADVKSYQLIGYGSRKLDQDSDVTFRAGVGFHDNHTRRDINTPGSSVVARGDFGGTSFNLGGAYAKTMKWGGRTSFTPSVRADYTWIQNNAYIESGAGGLGLSVNKNDTAMFVVGVDGKFLHEISDREKLAANIGLGFDLINERSTITSAFAGSPTAAFSTQGMKLDPWIVRGGIGYIYKMQGGTEINTRYDLDIRSGFTNQTVSVQGRWAF